MTRPTYSVEETREARIAGGINGVRRRFASAFRVYKTVGERKQLIGRHWSAEQAEAQRNHCERYGL